MQRSVFRARPPGVSLSREAKWRRLRALPEPPCTIKLRPHYRSRLGDYYHNILRDDLMLLTYVHKFTLDSPPTPPRTTPRVIRPMYDPENPYVKNRPNPPVGGTTHTGITRKPIDDSAPDSVIQLESIHLHTFVKAAISSRVNLLPAIMALRVLSGATKQGGGHHTARGVEIIKGKKMEGGWIRPGIPCGAKVELKGDQMYEFLATLTTFVLPRLKDFAGIDLPPLSATPYSPSMVSGTVSFGLPPSAMALFPQIEINVDAYPRLDGFHIICVTNTRGVGAQMRARQLLSGFQIPFARR